jgi:hypothetical protein
MANPTTNYGFVLPTPTDLVTDLPADFDVALQGVDTRLKALQPGTTLGDIVYSSATANTNTRLAIGSTNQVLTVTGGVPVWATPAGGGKLLQVVFASTGTYTTSTSTTFADTTLTATITPSSVSSKILVLVSQNGVTKSSGDNNTTVKIKLLRGASDILLITDMDGYTGTSNTSTQSSSASYLDSPATTSATTYKTQFASGVAGQNVYVQNYIGANGNTKSTITLMEIGA